jgi:hypothetical protein
MQVRQRVAAEQARRERCLRPAAAPGLSLPTVLCAPSLHSRPTSTPHPPHPPPRPYELIPGVAAALSSVSLAEAQQLAAFRLEERGGAPATAAALHVAAAELYDKAARELRSDGSEPPLGVGAGVGRRGTAELCDKAARELRSDGSEPRGDAVHKGMHALRRVGAARPHSAWAHPGVHAARLLQLTPTPTPASPPVDQNTLSDRAKRFLGCASALATARAHKHNSTELGSQMQVGGDTGHAFFGRERWPGWAGWVAAWIGAVALDRALALQMHAVSSRQLTPWVCPLPPPCLPPPGRRRGARVRGGQDAAVVRAERGRRRRTVEGGAGGGGQGHRGAPVRRLLWGFGEARPGPGPRACELGEACGPS